MWIIIEFNLIQINYVILIKFLINQASLEIQTSCLYDLLNLKFLFKNIR